LSAFDPADILDVGEESLDLRSQQAPSVRLACGAAEGSTMPSYIRQVLFCIYYVFNT
jgi:hypothetical protein